MGPKIDKICSIDTLSCFTTAKDQVALAEVVEVAMEQVVVADLEMDAVSALEPTVEMDILHIKEEEIFASVSSTHVKIPFFTNAFPRRVSSLTVSHYFLFLDASRSTKTAPPHFSLNKTIFVARCWKCKKYSCAKV